MTKRNRIIYWIATLWLSLGMVSTGVAQLMQVEEVVAGMQAMGIPYYIINVVAVWKILGVVAILLPGYVLLKEWAYAGFFFLVTGAIFSHIAVGDPLTDLFGPVLLLFLTILSWYMRPPDRRLSLSENPVA